MKTSRKLNEHNIIHMGDFNSRCKKLTGDHADNAYTKMFEENILKDFKILTNNDNKPTYEPLHFKNKRTSIIDYFLTRKENHIIDQYKVLPVTLLSWHHVISAQMKITPNQSHDAWGNKKMTI